MQIARIHSENNNELNVLCSELNTYRNVCRQKKTLRTQDHKN